MERLAAVSRTLETIILHQLNPLLVAWFFQVIRSLLFNPVSGKCQYLTLFFVDNEERISSEFIDLVWPVIEGEVFFWFIEAPFSRWDMASVFVLFDLLVFGVVFYVFTTFTELKNLKIFYNGGIFFQTDKITQTPKFATIVGQQAFVVCSDLATIEEEKNENEFVYFHLIIIEP